MTQSGEIGRYDLVRAKQTSDADPHSVRSAKCANRALFLALTQSCAGQPPTSRLAATTVLYNVQYMLYFYIQSVHTQITDTSDLPHPRTPLSHR